LDYRFPRLLLDIRELDIILGDPLVIISYSKVAIAIDYLVAIDQELLLVTEVGLEYIGLLLGIEPLYFAHSYSIEAT
jgi:hypothetical protein